GCSTMDTLEGNIGSGPMLSNDVCIVHAGIAFVCRDFGYRKMLCCCLYQIRQELCIAGVPVSNLNGSDNISLHTTHDMDFHPVVLLTHDTILMINPPHKARRCEARGISGKICFYRFQWQATFYDEFPKQGSQRSLL